MATKPTKRQREVLERLRSAGKPLSEREAGCRIDVMEQLFIHGLVNIDGAISLMDEDTWSITPAGRDALEGK